MTKSKKGRASLKATDQPVKGRSSLRQAVEKAKRDLTKLDKIDVSTLADDDPKTKARSKAKGYAALQIDDSSDDSQSTGIDQCATPRKGIDKKRQRFADTMEVIEMERDDSSDRVMDPPSPIRLLQQDTDMETSPNCEVTIADILGEGPETTTTLPEPLIINKDCRYNLQVKVKACELPTEFIAATVTNLFVWLQNKVGKAISIATWDDAKDKQKVYNRPNKLPNVTDTTEWTNIWSNWVSVKPKQDGTAFLKIRFVTQSPDTLLIRLPEIGSLKDEIASTVGINIGRLPIPCQAVKVGCVGWLFGTNKHINSNDLVQEISRLINLPPHVRIGISWRAIKLENGRTPPWIENIQPASALHIDMDWLYGPVYKPTLANLFKKHGTVKPLGLTLRLIPCFSSDEGKNATQDQRLSAIDMREKQEFVLREHLTVIKTPYILNLDKPTQPNGTMTLRRYLKNLHPQGLVAARLIVSVDRAWQDGSKDTNVVTTREYAPQVQEALRNMIPECVHRFGKGVNGWFTREGLVAFQGIQWDPTNKKSVSDKDVEAMRMVAEDFFGLGNAWRQRAKKSTQPEVHDAGTKERPGDPSASIVDIKGKPPVTVNTLLENAMNKTSDAPSFGDLYHRNHDGDTAKTSHVSGADDVSISSHESDAADQSITLDNLPTTLARVSTQQEGDASTAKSSTHYRLQRDKQKELTAKSQAESRQLWDILQKEREELQRAREELAKLKVTAPTIGLVTPSAKQGTSGAAADSAGDHG